MPKEIQIISTPEGALNEEEVKQLASHKTGIPLKEIKEVKILRKSIDARKRQVKILLKVEIYKLDERIDEKLKTFDFQKVSDDNTCHIVGFGPAGIYAAFQLLERGIKPIVIERGKEVHARLKDIGKIHKKLAINPESNYCFGEGGAGTYSDGKLYTRSSKRGDIKKVLDVFIQHGADDKISYEAHPHIGTNKLPKIIEKMRQTIIENGGEVHFEKKLIDIIVDRDRINFLICDDGNQIPVKNLILATGHSARDIFELLHNKKILMEAKPFALGVRIEHHQSLIDSIQYKAEKRSKFLPPASYSLVTQARGRGVFSFCMCPGGVIAPAGTTNKEVVVNGWSSSKRNGPYSNSGLVVQVNPENWQQYSDFGPLAALQFQAEIEQRAYQSTGNIKAPAQRVEDFIQKKISNDIPRNSYLPGLVSKDLREILPHFITESLKEGLIAFGKKMKGYRTNEAVLVGVESRTSSPVRIPRDRKKYHHPQVKNLFPCGEGAGYAGGIVSAAMDGIACANAV